jgi:hypothetical protein
LLVVLACRALGPGESNDINTKNHYVALMIAMVCWRPSPDKPGGFADELSPFGTHAMPHI